MCTVRCSMLSLFKYLRSVRFFVALALVGLALTQVVFAADIRLVRKLPKVDAASVIILSLNGPIEPGDIGKFETLLGENGFSEGNVFEQRATVWLNSEEGDYDEGLKLGLLFSLRKIETVVLKDSVCSSACALAFLGGSVLGEEGASFSSRTLAVGGKVSFHAPPLILPEGTITKASVETSYAAAVATISAISLNSEELRLRTSLLPVVLTIGAGRFFDIATVDDLGLFGIATNRSFSPQFLTRSMVTNLCHNAYEWDAGRSASVRKANPSSSAEISDTQVKTGYFGDGERPTTRTIISVAAAAEGSSFYCVVDHVVMSGRLKVACRGFLLAFDPQEALERAKILDKEGGGSADAECDVPGSINALDPQGYQSFTDFRSAYALAPAGTPVGSIDAVIAGYETEEEPLTVGRR